MTTVTTIEVPCGAERHRVTMRADRLGRARWTPHDHERSVEDVLGALGGDPPPCVMVPRLFRELARVVPDVEDRIRWIGAGARSESDVKTWRSVCGIDDVAGWVALGVDSPASALRFVTRRLSLSRAQRWAAAGHLPSNDVLAWLDAGIDDPGEVAAWSAVGVRDGAEAG